MINIISKNKNDNVIKRKHGKLPTNISYIGLITMIFGILIVFTESLWGTIIVLIGAIFYFLYWGIIIDFEKGTYKKYYCVLGCNIGKWVTLPQINQVILKKRKVSRTLSSRGTSSKYFGNVYFVILETTQGEILIFKGSREAAIIDVNLICTLLNIKHKILD